MADINSFSDQDFLCRQLDGLGQLIADGEADEPDGKWIRQQYRQVAKTLGLIKTTRKRKNNDKIDKFMSKRLEDVKCDCGGELKQSRKGSFVGVCKVCGKKYRLGRTKR